MGLIWQTPLKNSVCMVVVAHSDTFQRNRKGFMLTSARMAPVIVCRLLWDTRQGRLELCISTPGHSTRRGREAFLKVLLTLTYLLHLFQ